jgi:hypothetical protein
MIGLGVRPSCAARGRGEQRDNKERVYLSLDQMTSAGLVNHREWQVFLSILAERDREVGKLGHPRSLTINCSFLTSTTIETTKKPIAYPHSLSAIC